MVSPCAEGGTEQLGAGVCGGGALLLWGFLRSLWRCCHRKLLLRAWLNLGFQRGSGHSAPHTTGPWATLNKHDRGWAVPRNKACWSQGPVSTQNSLSSPHVPWSSALCPQPLLSPNANSGGQAL